MESCHWIPSISVIHITGDFQKVRGIMRSAILATVGRFPSSLRNSELFGPEEEVGECSLGARTQSLRGGYWDNQKLILPEGWWSRRLLTLESRLSLPGALESWTSRWKISASNVGWVWLTRVLVFFFGSHRSKWEKGRGHGEK
jgi:hypothetical protein